MRYVHTTWLAVTVTCAACAPSTMDANATGSQVTPAATAVAKPSAGAAGAASNTLPPIESPSSPEAPTVNVAAAPPQPMAAAASAAPQPTAASAPAAPPTPAAAPPAPPAAGSSTPAAAGGPAKMVQSNPANNATGGASPADMFCDKYGDHCGYGMPNRHADRAACIADFNANPAQQACKIMHLDTAIAGTAAACNGMPSDFCFAIHCLHAAGITDPTGVTYCK